MRTSGAGEVESFISEKPNDPQGKPAGFPECNILTALGFQPVALRMTGWKPIHFKNRTVIDRTVLRGDGAVEVSAEMKADFLRCEEVVCAVPQQGEPWEQCFVQD